jgi:phosphoenolpyruvate-protein kinase (PTS system EI component)
MGQKGSNASQQQIEEYYERRHSFVEKPKDQKSNSANKANSKHGHRRAISKDLGAIKQAGRTKQL